MNTEARGSIRFISRKRIFIVHGRTDEVKEEVVSWVESLGLKPIILHEQPNAGRTIIEKFEANTDDIDFAIVLLTPEDFGYPIGGEQGRDPQHQPRARQNVIFELGFFFGKLGRKCVAALYTNQYQQFHLKVPLELPSDIQGILYIELDDAGKWQSELHRELRQAGLL